MDDEPNATHVEVDPALDFEAGPESETSFYGMSNSHDETVLVQDANFVLDIHPSLIPAFQIANIS